MCCGAVYDKPPTCAPPSTSNTYSPPITCKLPVDHDDPFHRAGEVSWETAEYALGRSAPEGLPR